jgi:siroheme synthase-like protein
MADTGDPYYPVSLDVSGRSCLVVGGGPVAARKARGLTDRGAAVTVIAASVGPDMRALAPSLRALETRPYRSGDAVGFRLVVTATGDSQVDAAVFADAEAAGVWVNSADDPEHSSFIVPAVHRDGTVTIAVSTGGASPALAVWLRSRLAAEPVVAGAGTLAALLGEARRRLRSSGRRSDVVDWRRLLDGPLPELVRAGAIDEAQAEITKTVGD